MVLLLDLRIFQNNEIMEVYIWTNSWHLLSWAELDMRASVLSKCELDTDSLFDSYALLSSLTDNRPFPAAAFVSDWSWSLKDSGSAKRRVQKQMSVAWKPKYQVKISMQSSNTCKRLTFHWPKTWKSRMYKKIVTYQQQQFSTSQEHPAA